MADRERLLELLNVNTCPNEICNFCEHFRNTSACERYKMERIADHLIQNGVTIQKWIPVTERLPEESDYYLYRANNPYRGLKNGVGVSYFMHKAKKWKATNGDYVTHWIPLPEPPKEVE